jgi:hypothetical protein
MLRSGLVTAAAIGALALPIAATGQDGDFRCGSIIVSAGMSKDDVLQNCGEPTSKVVDPIVVREGVQYAGTVPVEHWTYASDTVTRVLTFDQGKLVSIDVQ